MPVDCIGEFGQTALFLAALHNRTDAIRLLLHNGADVNKRDRWGNTPVHEAAMRNKTKVIAMLMKHGASINITNNDGEKPIDLVQWYGSEAAVRMLEQL